MVSILSIIKDVYSVITSRSSEFVMDRILCLFRNFCMKSIDSAIVSFIITLGKSCRSQRFSVLFKFDLLTCPLGEYISASSFTTCLVNNLYHSIPNAHLEHLTHPSTTFNIEQQQGPRARSHSGDTVDFDVSHGVLAWSANHFFFVEDGGVRRQAFQTLLQR